MLKIAVIVDHGLVPTFALRAIDLIAGVDEVTVFSCVNTRSHKRIIRNGAYYALNLLTVRNRLTRMVPLASGTKTIAAEIEFVSNYDGAWQTLPAEITRAIADGGFDCVLKFGMGLLRIPPNDQLAVPILSYHHGDPDSYRGRPAGFWETVHGTAVMGQIIQVIGNRLDAGKVVAFAETKVYPWSYRATLLESFRHSSLIINQAISNALAGTYLGKPCHGRNYRLPSNAAVVKFCARMAWRFLRRLTYGAFVEKKWVVSTARLPCREPPVPIGNTALPPAGAWQNLSVARGYTFYADPFYTHTADGIILEALSASSGLGEILLVSGDDHCRISRGTGHMSYPATITISGREYVTPETALWSNPQVCVIGDQLEPLYAMRIEGEPRVLDPTLFVRGERIYLFGNIASTGSGALYLWSSVDLSGTFVLHPASPIRVSPGGSRMAGSLVEHGGRTFRLGQDFKRGYGDGILVFDVTELSQGAYGERLIGSMRFDDRCGPHTLNFRDGEMVFDWYQDRFSPLAGVRRLLGRSALGRLKLPMSGRR